MSDSMEDIFAGEKAKASSSSKTFMGREVPSSAPTFGRSFAGADPRLFKGYDVLGGRAAKVVRWHVTVNRIMPAEEAGDKLAEIHGAYGLGGARPEEIDAFNNALFFCHTVNSGSTLQPGRSNLVVRGTAFPYNKVLEILGVDIRRFYRAFAGEVRRVNQMVLAGVSNTDDIEAQERFQWLMQVATQRSLTRHPDLAHDSSDCCWGLSMSERSALQAAKTGVFSSITNVADRFQVSRPMENKNAPTIYDSLAARNALVD